MSFFKGRKSGNQKEGRKTSANHINMGIGGSFAVAVLAIATPFIAQEEGLRTAAYLDPVNVPTICFGSTEGVYIGKKKTEEECITLLDEEVREFYLAVIQNVTVPLTHEQTAALTSFAYNVGIGAFKRSTLLKLLNKGKYQEACNELSRWVYAGGEVLPGLVKRREKERQLCLGSLEAGA